MGEGTGSIEEWRSRSEAAEMALAELEMRSATRIAKLTQKVEAYQRDAQETEQVLGQGLGYPWFKDDQTNFPGADEQDGVCIGDNVASTLAMEAIQRIQKLENKNE